MLTAIARLWDSLYIPKSKSRPVLILKVEFLLRVVLCEPSADFAKEIVALLP